MSREAALRGLIQRQAEFYFSPDNFGDDDFFQQKLLSQGGELGVELLLRCNKIRYLLGQSGTSLAHMSRNDQSLLVLAALTDSMYFRVEMRRQTFFLQRRVDACPIFEIQGHCRLYAACLCPFAHGEEMYDHLAFSERLFTKLEQTLSVNNLVCSPKLQRRIVRYGGTYKVSKFCKKLLKESCEPDLSVSPSLLGSLVCDALRSQAGSSSLTLCEEEGDVGPCIRKRPDPSAVCPFSVMDPEGGCRVGSFCGLAHSADEWTGLQGSLQTSNPGQNLAGWCSVHLRSVKYPDCLPCPMGPFCPEAHSRGELWDPNTPLPCLLSPPPRKRTDSLADEFEEIRSVPDEGRLPSPERVPCVEVLFPPPSLAETHSQTEGGDLCTQGDECGRAHLISELVGAGGGRSLKESLRRGSGQPPASLCPHMFSPFGCWKGGALCELPHFYTPPPALRLLTQCCEEERHTPCLSLPPDFDMGGAGGVTEHADEAVRLVNVLMQYRLLELRLEERERERRQGGMEDCAEREGERDAEGGGGGGGNLPLAGEAEERRGQIEEVLEKTKTECEEVFRRGRVCRASHLVVLFSFLEEKVRRELCPQSVTDREGEMEGERLHGESSGSSSSPSSLSSSDQGNTCKFSLDQDLCLCVAVLWSFAVWECALQLVLPLEALPFQHADFLRLSLFEAFCLLVRLEEVESALEKGGSSIQRVSLTMAAIAVVREGVAEGVWSIYSQSLVHHKEVWMQSGEAAESVTRRLGREGVSVGGQERNSRVLLKAVVRTDDRRLLRLFFGSSDRFLGQSLKERCWRGEGGRETEWVPLFCFLRSRASVDFVLSEGLGGLREEDVERHGWRPRERDEEGAESEEGENERAPTD
uniref:HTH La-type RNA-binding domain-containing protein n=1 Tax=Chromera velia CCMP2878 TaxID=1169474 RepID=A0A0G4GTW3_9ALVE